MQTDKRYDMAEAMPSHSVSINFANLSNMKKNQKKNRRTTVMMNKQHHKHIFYNGFSRFTPNPSSIFKHY